MGKQIQARLYSHASERCRSVYQVPLSFEVLAETFQALVSGCQLPSTKQFKRRNRRTPSPLKSDIEALRGSCADTLGS